MGMRIKTAIGFGLDITGMNQDHFRNRYDSDETLWDEITADILEDIRARKGDMNGEGIFFNEGFQEQAALKENRMKPFHIENCFIYDSEFLDENKILFQPYPFGEKWSRHDDDIDRFVSGILSPLLEPTDVIWETSKRGIYPYSGLMRRNPDKPLGVETYMESCYMDRDPEYVATLTTNVPLQVMFFIKHILQVDQKDILDVFFQVKPTFIRWWS